MGKANKRRDGPLVVTEYRNCTDSELSFCAVEKNSRVNSSY